MLLLQVTFYKIDDIVTNGAKSNLTTVAPQPEVKGTNQRDFFSPVSAIYYLFDIFIKYPQHRLRFFIFPGVMLAAVQI